MNAELKIFEYLYRDGGNNKVYGSLMLDGSISTEQENTFISSLNDGLWFVAEQVAVPALHEVLWKFSKGWTEEDSFCHEFIRFRNANESDFLCHHLHGETTVFIEKFVEINQHWDVFKSAYISEFQIC